MGNMRLLGGLQQDTWKGNPLSVLKGLVRLCCYDTGARVANKSGLLIKGGLEELFPNSWFWPRGDGGLMLRNEPQGLFGVS